MAEDFALSGIESNPVPQVRSADEALFADAYDDTKCLGGGPGAKCGARPATESPTVISSASPSTELPAMHGPVNGYPGVYFELPRNILGETRLASQSSDSSDYQTAKEASKQGSKQGSKPPEKKDPGQKEKPDSQNEPKQEEQPQTKGRPETKDGSERKEVKRKAGKVMLAET